MMQPAYAVMQGRAAQQRRAAQRSAVQCSERPGGPLKKKKKKKQSSPSPGIFRASHQGKKGKAGEGRDSEGG